MASKNALMVARVVSIESVATMRANRPQSVGLQSIHNAERDGRPFSRLPTDPLPMTPAKAAVLSELDAVGRRLAAERAG
jgi:hypothetical protein